LSVNSIVTKATFTSTHCIINENSVNIKSKSVFQIVFSFLRDEI
jgi:hypothetical protein